MGCVMGFGVGGGSKHTFYYKVWIYRSGVSFFNGNRSSHVYSKTGVLSGVSVKSVAFPMSLINLYTVSNGFESVFVRPGVGSYFSLYVSGS